MTKFKVGDKIRVRPDCRHKVGVRVTGVLTVTKGTLDNGDVYAASTSGSGWLLTSDYYQLVSESSPEVVPTPTGGLKFDTGKSPCELLSPIAMLATADVLAIGAKKYSPNNWRKGIVYTRLIGAIMRHLFAFTRGEDLDPESGLPHVDHLSCEVMFLQEFFRTRKDLDDRYKSPDQAGQQQGKKE